MKLNWQLPIGCRNSLVTSVSLENSIGTAVNEPNEPQTARLHQIKQLLRGGSGRGRRKFAPLYFGRHLSYLHCCYSPRPPFYVDKLSSYPWRADMRLFLYYPSFPWFCGTDPQFTEDVHVWRTVHFVKLNTISFFLHMNQSYIVEKFVNYPAFSTEPRQN